MKIAVITGASSGLGKEFFLNLKGDFDEVWLIARREDKLKEIASMREDVRTRVIAMDLTKEGSMAEIDGLIKECGGEIGMLINNAGYGCIGNVKDMPTEGQMGMVRLNNEVMVGMTSTALKYMKRGSEIINICSIASFTPNTRMTVYSSTKAFVMSFSRGLRAELKKEGISVLAVCPGPMATEFLACAGIEKGTSKTFDTLPYAEPAMVAKRSLRASKKGRAVYTPLILFKIYRVLAKLLPTGFMMKLAKT